MKRSLRLDETPGCVVLIFAGFTFGSFLMLGSEEAAVRLLGAVGLLLFGGMGTGFAVGVYATPKPRPAHNGKVVLPDGTTSAALVIQGSPGRQRAAAVGIALATLGFAVVFFNPEVLGPRNAGYQGAFGVAAVIGAIGAASVFRAWREREVFVALTPQGILVRGVGSAAYAPWRSIGDVGIAEVDGGEMLGIRTHSPDAILRSGGLRWLGGFDRSYTGYDLAASVAGLALPSDEVVRLVIHYFEHPRERARLGMNQPVLDL